MIDLEEAKQALIEADASLVNAAKKLGVPAIELRRLIARNHELIEIALEAAERDLDKAEQTLRNGLNSKDPMKRLQAAARILKSRFSGRR